MDREVRYGQPVAPSGWLIQLLVSMLTYRGLVQAFSELGLSSTSRVLVHSSPDPIDGGWEVVLGALLVSSELVMAPAFTRSTIVVPETGPENNAIEYGGSGVANAEAEFFHHGLPIDDAAGALSNALIEHDGATRSSHPVLSFTGIAAEDAFAFQTLEEPFGPIAWLAEQDGDILLLDVDHEANVSLHYAEQLAGRQTLTRWALTEDGVVECKKMPGCSKGFEAIREHLIGVVGQSKIGSLSAELIPLRDLLHIATSWIREDPRALLCGTSDCLYCPQVRASIREVNS